APLSHGEVPREEPEKENPGERALLRDYAREPAGVSNELRRRLRLGGEQLHRPLRGLLSRLPPLRGEPRAGGEGLLGHPTALLDGVDRLGDRLLLQLLHLAEGGGEPLGLLGDQLQPLVAELLRLLKKRLLVHGLSSWERRAPRWRHDGT